MTVLQAIVLGVVQGVTEFLPVSSSAHLILFSKLAGWPDQGLQFDMAANSGSLLAVILVLRRDLAALLRGLVAWLRGRPDESSTPALQLLVATLPVAVVGLLVQTFVAGDGRSLWVLGSTSLVFGLLLGWVDRRAAAPAEGAAWSWRAVTGVGLAQALALIPGTSRSGVTMTAALAGGMSRVEATRLSFLLAVPVGLLVAAKDGWDLARHFDPAFEPLTLFAGTAAAALSAFAAVAWLLRWVRQHGFMGFAAYRVLLGLVLLGLAVA